MAGRQTRTVCSEQAGRHGEQALWVMVCVQVGMVMCFVVVIKAGSRCVCVVVKSLSCGSRVIGM